MGFLFFLPRQFIFSCLFFCHVLLLQFQQFLISQFLGNHLLMLLSCTPMLKLYVISATALLIYATCLILGKSFDAWMSLFSVFFQMPFVYFVVTSPKVLERFLMQSQMFQLSQNCSSVFSCSNSLGKRFFRGRNITLILG